MPKNPLKITIVGIDNALSKFKKVGDKLAIEVDNEMEAVFIQMVTTAKSIFPSGNEYNQEKTKEYSDIRSSIRYKKLNNLSYQLMAGRSKSPMAAYIEFGTGRFFINYPGKEKEWQELARQYYINGKGYMKSSPYFYPTFKSYSVVLLSNLKRLFKRYEGL